MSVGVQAWGWEELGLSVVGVEADFPGGVVDQPVVHAAEQDEVVQAGGSAVDPVHDVVGVAGDREAVTTRERAVLVAQHQRDPDRGGDQALEAADVEDLALGAQHGRDQVRVTRQPTCRLGRHRVT